MLHNIRMVRFFLILAAAASFFLFAAEAYAQTLGASPLQFSVSPEVPGPGDTVLIEISGVGTFLGDANITWQQDGKTVKSGLGESSFTFKAGPLGSQTTIKATINSSSQGISTKSFTFRPSSVYLVWEADTSIPPWFKGKALYSAGSSFTVTALPQVVSGGRSISANNFSYRWSQNGTPIPQISGTGKNVAKLQGSWLSSSETVDVDIYSGDTAVAHGEITLPAVKPGILFYVSDPLRGTLFDTALQNSISLSGSEFTLDAEPYYFSNSSLASGAAPYAWTLNGNEVTGLQSAYGLLTLRQIGSGAGQALVDVSVQNTDSDKYVQSAETALRVLFGGATAGASTLFGL